MPEPDHRITVNPRQCAGRPCIRGMRIRVTDILDLFAAGLSADQILAEMPDLERDDLHAALIYAARNEGSRVSASPCGSRVKGLSARLP